MSRIPVIGFGAGGHAKVVIDALQLGGKYDVVGLLDSNPRLRGTTLLDVPVIGGDELLETRPDVRHFFVGIGSVRDASIRVRVYAHASGKGLIAIPAIHPSAIISPRAVLGDGVTVLAGAIVNAGARLGTNCIVNTGAIIEHDCVVGEHANVATGARLGGDVVVGARAHIGGGATIRQGIRIGDGAVVGAGAVVVADVPPSVVVVGVPARPQVVAAG